MKTLMSFTKYEVADKKLQTLKLKLTEAEGKATELVAAINAASGEGMASRLENKARALLSGDTSASSDMTTLRQELTETRGRAAILCKAVELQNKETDKARAEASHKICEEVAPEHRKLAGRIAQAAAELARANSKLCDFMGDLEAGGVSIGTLPGALYPRTGFWDDPHAAVHFYLKEMREAGIIGKDELLPPEVRPEVPPDGYEALSAGPTGIAIVRYRNGKPEPVKTLYDASEKAVWD